MNKKELKKWKEEYKEWLAIKTIKDFIEYARNELISKVTDGKNTREVFIKYMITLPISEIKKVLQIEKEAEKKRQESINRKFGSLFKIIEEEREEEVNDEEENE